jgi:pimeloyl-ACP methyl ester carboxylesterase
MTMTGAISGVVTSTDGTPIAWTRQGEGPAIVMVGAVMASRARTPQPGLPAALAQHFTVLTYDRRGTGESGSQARYGVEQEFEDLALLLQLAGPDAAVYGFSSGATLALLAAVDGVPIPRLLLLEPPLVPDPDLGPLQEAHRRLSIDPADARRWFDEEITGIPAHIRAQFPPLTAEHLANAPAMLHELAFLPGTTPARFSTLTVPTLLMASDHTAPNLLQAVRDLGRAVPNAVVRVLPGQWHGIDDDTLVLVIHEFLNATAVHAAAKEAR